MKKSLVYSLAVIAVLALVANTNAFFRRGVNVNVAVGSGVPSYSGLHSFSYGHNFVNRVSFDPYPVTAFSFTAPLALQSYAYFTAPTFALQAQPPVYSPVPVQVQAALPAPPVAAQQTTTTTTTTTSPAVLPGDPGVTYNADPAPAYSAAYGAAVYPLTSGLFRVGSLYGSDVRAIARVNAISNVADVNVNVLGRARFRNQVNVAVNGSNQQINVDVRSRPRLLGRRRDEVQVTTLNQNGQFTRVDVTRSRPRLGLRR